MGGVASIGGGGRNAATNGIGHNMDLSFRTPLAASYTIASQKIRIMSEDWIARSIYCPNCGRSDVVRHGNNSRVSDFFCAGCNEEYEAKSLSRRFGDTIVDGAYSTMIERLKSAKNPNFSCCSTTPGIFLYRISC